MDKNNCQMRGYFFTRETKHLNIKQSYNEKTVHN